jgi:iron complex outermembrane receptor protein
MSLTNLLATVRPGFTERPAAWVLTAAALLLAAPARAAPPPIEVARDFTELSLQELLDVQVTSVSKHAEPLRHAAAAISVVTGDEIRRSGARTIADALRLVPGVQVYRTNAQAYTVTARGFGGDKLEVLLDGRSAYTPLTSTVFWDTLDTFLPDIDRIEMIRGPGATLWGANAVNGVINIVTRRSAETVGIRVEAGGGKEETAHAGFRAGSTIGDSAHGRVYAKGFERDASRQRDGSDTFDGQRQGQAGFRTDWSPSKGQDLTVTGDYYHGRQTTKDLAANQRADDAKLNGGNLLANWSSNTAQDSQLSVQAYYDFYRRVVPGTFDDQRYTGDVQLQHRFDWGDVGTVTWGLGYRASHDETGGPPNAIIFAPDSRTLETASAFGQLQHRFGEHVELTVGSKFDRHESEFEAQPGVRLGWAFAENAFSWASVSRAVRLPNRLDEDVAIFCSPVIAGLLGCAPGTTVRIGNSDLESEKLIAYEWGLRAWTSSALSVDLTTFYNTYTDLRSTEATPPPIGSFANRIEAESYGGELALAWAPTAWLKLRPSYSLLRINADQGDSTDAHSPRNLEEGSPEHSASIQFNLAPLSNLTVDGQLRHASRLERQQVPAYTELNLRLGWKPARSLELALVGADLLDRAHPEAGTQPSSTNPNPPRPSTEIQRAIWLDLVWDWQ